VISLFATIARKVPAVFLAEADDATHQRRGKRLLLLLLLVTLAGVGAAGVAFAKGYHVMGTTSEVPWGVLIATYVFFAVSSTGLSLVGSLGHVFGLKLFAPLAKKATFLALVTLLTGFAVIALELERPILLLRLVLFSPNLASPIWWMGTLYGLYFIFMAIEFVFLLRGDHHRAKIAGIIHLVAAVLASSNLGAVFALNHARPVWYGPFLPVYIIITGLVSGAALLVALVYLEDYFSKEKALKAEHEALYAVLRKILALGLALLAFVTLWKLITGLQGDHPHRAAVTRAMLDGPLFVSFWGAEIFFGLVAPLTLLLGPWRSSPAYVAVAAITPLAALWVARLNFVYSGQMLSLKPMVGPIGERLSYAPPFKGSVAGFLPYTPSLVEVLIVAGALAGAVLLFVVGRRILDLEEASS
jgi:molybdopterin-containing oxidoreductase family membrane subunit